MPVVEQRQGSPPGRQFRVKWTAEEGGDGTTFSSWMRPPTGAVRYRSSDLHEQARGPLALLQKVDAKVLAALVEYIDSPFEPGLTRSDSAHDGASPSSSWAAAAAASPSRRMTAEAWMAPELRWLIVASGWNVTVDLLRQAVAANSALLARLDKQLQKIGTWDDLYVPVSVECAMAGLKPEPSPRTPALSAVVAPEGALTSETLEALLQSAVAPLLQRLEMQAEDLESLRTSGAAVAKQLRVERTLRRLHEKKSDTPPLGGGALKLMESVPSELVEAAQSMWGYRYDPEEDVSYLPPVADVATLTAEEDIDMTELSLDEDHHRDDLVPALGPFFFMNDLEMKLLSGVSVSAKQLVADFRDRESRWTKLHASLFTLSALVYRAADSADPDAEDAVDALDLPQQLERALQLSQQTLGLSVQMRAHDHSALRKKLEKSSGVAQEARDALAALRTARVDTHVHRGLIGEADLTDMVKAMEHSESIAKDLSGKKGSAASAKQADAQKAKKSRMADAASRKKFFTGGKGSAAKGAKQQQQQQPKQQQQQRQQQQRTPDRQEQRAPATPANGGGDRGTGGAAGRR